MNYLQYEKIDNFVCSALAPGHPESPNGTAASIQYCIGTLCILWRVVTTFISLVPKVHGAFNFKATGRCWHRVSDPQMRWITRSRGEEDPPGGWGGVRQISLLKRLGEAN